MLQCPDFELLYVYLVTVEQIVTHNLGDASFTNDKHIETVVTVWSVTHESIGQSAHHFLYAPRAITVLPIWVSMIALRYQYREYVLYRDAAE